MDAAAHALAQSWSRIGTTLSGGWARVEAGATAAVTGIPVPYLNGVFVIDAPRDTVAALLDAVAATRLPHCVLLRPGTAGDVAALPAARGMTRSEDVPLMVLNSINATFDAPHPADLTIRRLRPEEAELHAHTAAAGFEAPPEVFVRLMPPEVLRFDGARCYVAEVEGEPVATGYGERSPGGGVGIFNIATIRRFRGRGFGSAVTARVLADAAADGATWAWLQSTADGYGVYERLGFRSTGSWQRWISS